jgi:hypothetical protein
MKSEKSIIDDPSIETLSDGWIDKENLPTVSFCIPTYNNENTIGRCLQSYRDQTIIYEQVVLGTRGMIKGLVRDRDLIWFLFPALLFVRAIAFAYTLFNLGTEKMKSKIERI